MTGVRAVHKALNKLGLAGIEVSSRHQAVVLEGEVESWDQYVAAGYAAAGKGFRGVVNDIQVNGLQGDTPYLPPDRDNSLEGEDFDAVIIGGGVVGCAVARELTRWNLRIALVEKEDDVAKQASSRNNGMIHPGLAPSRGTKKLDYNLRGNEMYSQAAAELGFELKRCGSLVLLEKPWYRLFQPAIKAWATKKGVPGIESISRQSVQQREPRVTSRQQGALFLPSTGVVAPYKVTMAYAENAVENGAQVFLNTAVLGFDMDRDRIRGVITNRGVLQSGVVINAAGVWADRVAAYAHDRFFTIHGRKGTIAILDKNTSSLQKYVLGMPQLVSKTHSKGGGVNPTVEGNLLMGPNAVEVPHREDWGTTPQDMEYLVQRLMGLNTSLKRGDIITYFAGVRACTFEEDFIIQPSDSVQNLVHAAGIQSPGLASAPAIAQDVAQMAVNILQRRREVKPNPTFRPQRRVVPDLSRLSFSERAELIRKNPAYGRIVCRCEVISEGEIVDAINGPVPATNLDAIKRRVRAGMGRCQGGFCTPSLVEIVARETGLKPQEVCKGRPGSNLLAAETKAPGREEHA